MKLPITKLIGAAALVLLMMLSVSSDALGQRRNRRVFSRVDKKCGKFVNCHDARDGRWDGRGPRRNGSVLSTVILGRRRRSRDVDVVRSRRGRGRDFDRNGRGRRLR